MPNSYWFLAPPGPNRDGIYSTLKSSLQQSGLISDVTVFDVPQKLKFGTLDDLVALLDDVTKYDALIEGVCRRFEKMGLEIDPTTEYKIIWQRNTLSVDDYLKRFVWDEAKYSPQRPLKRNVELLVNGVSKLDDEVRVKQSQWVDVRNQVSNLTKAGGASLATRDLVDILTPDVVGDPSPFVYSEKLTTVVVVVPKNECKEFESRYWRLLDAQVVPHSLTRFTLAQRFEEGVYAVVLFNSAVGEFRDACRQAFKAAVRVDYRHDGDAFGEKAAKLAKLDAQTKQQETLLSRICVAAFSESFVAWVHIKAVRVFVEFVMRYGTNAPINVFLLQLPMPFRKEQKLRSAILGITSASNSFGNQYFNSDAKVADEEQLFPYIQLEITPFQAAES